MGEWVWSLFVYESGGSEMRRGGEEKMNQTMRELGATTGDRTTSLPVSKIATLLGILGHSNSDWLVVIAWRES